MEPHQVSMMGLMSRLRSAAWFLLAFLALPTAALLGMVSGIFTRSHKPKVSLGEYKGESEDDDD